MKAKLLSIVLILTAAGVGAAAIVYVKRLESRTRLLETRLARVEAELNRKGTSDAWTVTPPTLFSKPGAAPALQTRRFPPQGASQDSLEHRVEKIEQELAPHLELLSSPRSEAPGVTR